MQGREITYAEAINEAIDQSMEKDPSVFIIGEGVPDPKRIFGTTNGLLEKYGPKRVAEMPVAENGMTGICIGAALNGLMPIMVHQRIDFSLLALDQLINNAAKWNFMFGGQTNVPIVIRLIIGRGWGQGAQHSQNLQALFSHIPGLKVIMPTTAYDAKGLLISSIKHKNPVIFIEHRWLYHLKSTVPEESYEIPIGKAKISVEGTDITLASTSYMTIEAIKAANVLKKAGISAEVVDIRTLKPLDEVTIINSIKKTGRLLALDLGYQSGGFAGEVIARVCEKVFRNLKAPPQRITLPDLPTPTSHALTKYYYPTHFDIIKKAFEMVEKQGYEELIKSEKNDSVPSDVPNRNFIGPF